MKLKIPDTIESREKNIKIEIIAVRFLLFRGHIFFVRRVSWRAASACNSNIIDVCDDRFNEKGKTRFSVYAQRRSNRMELATYPGACIDQSPNGFPESREVHDFRISCAV